MFESLVLLAGFIDSIAGGGGLITVPTLSLIVGPGAHAIGTNKILGVTAAGIALFTYWRGGHLKIKNSLPTLLGILAGTVNGALLAPFVPRVGFQLALLIFSPLILVLLFRRDSLVAKVAAENTVPPPHRRWLELACGFGCGFYDGVFGPGGGTLMMLSLLWILHLPLMEAIALSKLSNTLSAGGSLATYAATGYVHWSVGAWFALFIGAGALVGSRLASLKARVLVKPVLVLVVSLLWLRVAYDLWSQ